MMSQSSLQLSTARLRSFVLRLPLTTRILLLLIFAFWLASIPLAWMSEWGALIPSRVTLRSCECFWFLRWIRVLRVPLLFVIDADHSPVLAVYRLNAYPLIHLGFFHAFCNVLALSSLLERFEAEHGTLVTMLLFTGRK